MSGSPLLTEATNEHGGNSFKVPSSNMLAVITRVLWASRVSCTVSADFLASCSAILGDLLSGGGTPCCCAAGTGVAADDLVLLVGFVAMNGMVLYQGDSKC